MNPLFQLVTMSEKKPKKHSLMTYVLTAARINFVQCSKKDTILPVCDIKLGEYAARAKLTIHVHSTSLNLSKNGSSIYNIYHISLQI